MVLHVTAVVFQRAGPEDGGHLFQLPIQPLRECHPALLRQIYTLIGCDVLPEFGSQFFLGVGVDVSEDGFAVLLVAQHDAALPAAVLPLADHAVTGRSSLCHCSFHLRGFIFDLRRNF